MQNAEAAFAHKAVHIKEVTAATSFTIAVSHIWVHREKRGSGPETSVGGLSTTLNDVMNKW
jgi:hypothetical protein